MTMKSIVFLLLCLFLLIPRPGSAEDPPSVRLASNLERGAGAAEFEAVSGAPGDGLRLDWPSGIAFGALALLVLASFLLRVQVQVKTSELSRKARRLEEEIRGRESMEAALRASEGRYRGVFENTGTATVIIEEDKTISMVNSEFEKLSGYARNEVEGRMTWERFVHPDDLDRVEQYHKARRKEGEPAPSEYEFRFLDREGHFKYVLNRVGLIPGTPKSVSSLMNVTSVKRADEALRNSEEKYRNILQSIVEGYYEVDLQGNFTFVNDALCRIFDYPRKTLLSMNLKDFTSAEDGRKGHETFRSVYETGRAVKSFEWQILRKDGTERHVEASVALMRDPREQTVGFRGILHDVTDRKLAEEERNRLSVQLRQAQKMEALGTLAGGIAHNFNNLLMGIQGYASLMLLESEEDPPRRKMLESIQKQVHSGSKLTTQLLGYAREGALTALPFKLNDLVQETADTFGATRRDIVVRQDLDPDLLPILGDSGQIEQILMNLLINAADAMPRGGEVVLRTRTATRAMMSGKPYQPKAGPYVLLVVQDNGLGMDRETQDRIFEPFFTTKGLVNGTGLGLASVYGIVKAHGGYIDVASKPDHGTTFSVFLPAATDAGESSPASTEPERGGEETVLLVDDEEIVLEVGERMLRQLGYRVLVAQSGFEALERLQEREDSVDLVILDMIMPGMSGFELFQEIRSFGRGARTLLSSGYSLNSQAREILDAGCDGFIQKPFDLKELARKVRALLDA